MIAERRLLVVAPAFHGYGRSIAEGFAAHGFTTAVHAYDELSGLADRVGNKVTVELPELLGSSAGRRRANDRATTRAIDAIDAFGPDVVLVVRGDALGTGFWERVDGADVPTIVWLYDELARMAFDPEVLRRRRAVATYSPGDAENLLASGVPSLHLPNAFDTALTFVPRRSDEITFVGAAYPNRVDLLERLHRRAVPVRAFGRDWSRHPVDRLRTWSISRPDVPAERDVPMHEAYGIMGGSLASLNIHNAQDGFTMRTFEICGTGGLQLIDRGDVGSLYEPGVEVLTFDGIDELVDLCRRADRDREWRDRIATAGRRRTIAEHTYAHRAAQLVPLWD